MRAKNPDFFESKAPFWEDLSECIMQYLGNYSTDCWFKWCVGTTWSLAFISGVGKKNRMVRREVMIQRWKFRGLPRCARRRPPTGTIIYWDCLALFKEGPANCVYYSVHTHDASEHFFLRTSMWMFAWFWTKLCSPTWNKARKWRALDE